MASVQDHTPVVKELSERRQQDPQLISETPREPSPRFSQLHDPLPEAADPHIFRRATSTTTNPSTLVNHPGTGTGTATSGGAQNASVIQDLSYHQSTSSPDRRPPALYDPTRGENTVHAQPSDDGEHERRRRMSVPRPLPIFSLPQDGDGNGNTTPSGVGLRGILDWNLDPHGPQQLGPKTVLQRLDPTRTAATRERDKYKRKARQQSVLINGAIGLQVIVGAITTGVAAGSKNIGSAVAVLGGISTALASYLAKARGSGEPEFSTLRARELSTFLREVDAFVMDHGHKVGSEFDFQIKLYRERFELIIKTEGEDSASGTGYASHPRPNQHMNIHPAGQQVMAGTFGARNLQAMPPYPDGGNGQPNEKPMWKDEKALSGMV